MLLPLAVPLIGFVTITLLPQLEAVIMCDRGLVDIIIGEDLYLITWQCGSNQLQHNKTISVQAGLSEGVQNVAIGNITVAANGVIAFLYILYL